MSFIVKNTTFPGLLDLIAPHSCRSCKRTGEALCDRCKNNIITEFSNYCPNCKTYSPTDKCLKCKSLPPTFVIGSRSGLIGTLVHDFKYNSNRALVRPLAEIINSIIPQIDGNITIVPLPTINRHIRERGLDHTLLIAKHLAKIRGSHYHTSPIIIRAQNTVQVGSDRKTRIHQASLAYSINPKFTIDKNTTYLLFDDVWTTGASIKNATKILRKAGAKKIIIVILAVSQINQE